MSAIPERRFIDVSITEFLPHQSHGVGSIGRRHGALVTGALPRRVEVEQRQRVEVLGPVDGHDFQRGRRHPTAVGVGEGRLAAKLVVRKAHGPCHQCGDGQSVEHAAFNAGLHRSKLQVDVGRGLERVANHEQGHQRCLGECEKFVRLLHFGTHDALDGTNMGFQADQFCLGPERRVRFIATMVSGRSGLQRFVRHPFETTQSHPNQHQAGCWQAGCLGCFCRHAQTSETLGQGEGHASFERAERADTGVVAAMQGQRLARSVRRGRGR